MPRTANLLHVRWMIRRDMPEVMEINDAVGLAWTEEEYLERLRARNCIGTVAERGDEIRGHMIYELHRTSLKLLLFAVPHGPDREEIAAALFDKLLYKLVSHRRQSLDFAVLLAPEWLTNDVRALLANESPYLPVLADALEDAGCTERWLLDALRSMLDVPTYTPEPCLALED